MQNANVFEQLYEESQIYPTPPSKDTSVSPTQHSKSEKRPSSHMHNTKSSKKQKKIAPNTQVEVKDSKITKRTRKSKAR